MDIEGHKRAILGRINNLVNEQRALDVIGHAVDEVVGPSYNLTQLKSMIGVVNPALMAELPNPLPESFSGRLEAYRERLGISKSELARRSEITASYYHMLITTDTKPSLGATLLLGINLLLLPSELEDFIKRAEHSPIFLKRIKSFYF